MCHLEGEIEQSIVHTMYGPQISTMLYTGGLSGPLKCIPPPENSLIGVVYPVSIVYPKTTYTLQVTIDKVCICPYTSIITTLEITYWKSTDISQWL